MLTLVALLIMRLACVEAGLGYRCPDPVSTQSPWIVENFDLELFTGPDPYYELALHDLTQPKICGCTRSLKRLQTAEPRVQDNFTMACPWNGGSLSTKIYISPLAFNTSENRGVLRGYWAITKNTIFPNTVVDVGRTPGSPKAPYRWALEYQCVENKQQTEAVFFAVNFYSRANVGEEAETNYQEMLKAAQVAGIDQYWNNTSAGLRRNNHTNCIYE